jgi:hypothetical protein
VSRRVSRLLVTAVLSATALAFLPTLLREMRDFEVYWTAGQRALEGSALYRTEDGHYQLKYLPAFALAFAPLSLLPLRVAKTIWFLLSVGASVALFAMCVRMLPARRTRVAWLVLTTIVLTLKFFAHELNLGQTNILMTLLVVIGFAVMSDGRKGQSGWWLAAATVVKPYAVAFLPYLAIKNYWRPAATFLAGFALCLLAPIALNGLSGTIALLAGWVEVVSRSTAPNLLDQDNVSVWAMYAKWFGVGSAASVWAAFTIALLGVAVLFTVWKGRSLAVGQYLEMALLLVLLPLVSPQGWDYVLLCATPAVMLIVDRFAELPLGVQLMAGSALGTMAFSIFDVLGRRAYAAFMSVSPITVCAIVIVFSLVYLRTRRLA